MPQTVRARPCRCLDQSGFDHGEPEDVTAFRILVLEDLDGNRVVVSTALSGN
jgi:hypothetical protein